MSEHLSSQKPPARLGPVMTIIPGWKVLLSGGFPPPPVTFLLICSLPGRLGDSRCFLGYAWLSPGPSTRSALGTSSLQKASLLQENLTQSRAQWAARWTPKHTSMSQNL